MEDKKLVVTPQEEIKELKDEQLETVTGGLGVQTVGPVNLNSLRTGQALPEDTTFGHPSKTSSPSVPGSRRPKI